MAGFIGSIFGGRGKAARARPTEELGTSGAVEHGGYLVSHERNPKMRGAQRYQEFGNLLANVAIVAAGARAYLNLVGKSTWTVLPADTPEGDEGAAIAAQEAADLVATVIKGMDRPWSSVVRRTAMFRLYGFSVQEWTARRNEDGTVGLKDVAPRPQATIERWKLDPAGNVEGCTQRNEKTGVEVFLPRDKIVHAIDDAISDSPEGIGLLRHLADSNQRLQRYLLLEGYGFETDLRGIPVARIPYSQLREDTNLSTEQVAAIVRPLEEFIEQHIKNPALGLALDSQPYRDEGPNLTPSGALQWDISLLTGTPGTEQQVAAAIEREVRYMAVVLGVQGLLLGGDGSGSLALGRTFSDQFALMADSGLTEIAETYEADLVPVITRLNGIPDELKPQLKTELAQHRDIQQITAVLRDLADSGSPLAPDDPAINEVRALAGLSPIDLDALAEDARIGAEAARELALEQARNPKPVPGLPDPEEDDLDEEVDD
jgi:hypothetical protein